VKEQQTVLLNDKEGLSNMLRLPATLKGVPDLQQKAVRDSIHKFKACERNDADKWTLGKGSRTTYPPPWNGSQTSFADVPGTYQWHLKQPSKVSEITDITNTFKDDNINTGEIHLLTADRDFVGYDFRSDSTTVCRLWDVAELLLKFKDRPDKQAIVKAKFIANFGLISHNADSCQIVRRTPKPVKKRRRHHGSVGSLF
jgi:hypothetical protein